MKGTKMSLYALYFVIFFIYAVFNLNFSYCNEGISQFFWR